MTLSRDGRGQRGCGAAAAVGGRRVAAAALVTAALFAGLWAGPAALASSPPRAGATAAPLTVTPGHTAPVRYYIVPPPGHGAAVTLFAIAAQALGNGSRYPEIFTLNRGRLQPDGARLASPRAIDTGWILQLPAGAAGPGVRFGPLPVVRPAAPAATPPAAPASRPPAAAAAASPSSSLSILTALGVLLLIVALAVTGVLAARRPWRRLRPAAAWRAGRGMHGQATRPQAGAGGTVAVLAAKIPALAATVPARLGRRPAARDGHLSPATTGRLGAAGLKHPSFPGAGYPGAGRSGQPDVPGTHPSGRERPGPRDAGRSGPGSGSRQAGADPYDLGAERPSLLGIDPFGALGPDHPSYPGAGGRFRPVGPGQAPWPAAEPLSGPQQVGGTSGPPPGWSRRPYQDAGGGHHETALGPAPVPGQVRGPLGRHAADLAQLDPQQAAAGFDTDSLRLAEQILAEADEQAIKIVTTAEQAAAELGRQAAAALTAAEQEAASLRAAVAEMTAELSRVAATVIERLAAPAAASAASRPRRDTADRTAARLQVKPGARPGARRSPGRSRRVRIARPARFTRWWPSRYS
jgi:hypothetical protein